MHDKNNQEKSSGQLAQTRANLALSASELNHFLQQMRDKSPRDVLGAVSQSGLARAVFQATVGCIVIMIVFTVGPYLWSKSFPAAEKKPVAKAAEQPAAPADTKKAETPAATPGIAPDKGTAASKTDNPKQTVSKDALDKLGLTETKTGSPKVNPLDKSADDLLKDLDKK